MALQNPTVEQCNSMKNLQGEEENISRIKEHEDNVILVKNVAQQIGLKPIISSTSLFEAVNNIRKVAMVNTSSREKSVDKSSPNLQEVQEVSNVVSPKRSPTTLVAGIERILNENIELKEKYIFLLKKTSQLITEKILLQKKLSDVRLKMESFQNDDNRVKFYTGLSCYATLKELFNFVKSFIVLVREGRKGRKIRSNSFERFMITLIKLRLNLPLEDIGYRFGISVANSSKVFQAVLHTLYIRLHKLIYWPRREELRKTMPVQFRASFGNKVAVIVDCFEVKIAKPSNLVARAQTWSEYKHHNTIKFLIGVTPQGSVSFISEAWGGRSSDKHITENCGILQKLLPGDVILADRGFNVKESVGLMSAEIKTPNGTRGREQISPFEIENTRIIARMRIHVERVIGLIRHKYSILNTVMPITQLTVHKGDNKTNIDKIVVVCCCLANLCESIVPLD